MLLSILPQGIMKESNDKRAHNLVSKQSTPVHRANCIMVKISRQARTTRSAKPLVYKLRLHLTVSLKSKSLQTIDKTVACEVGNQTKPRPWLNISLRKVE